MKIGVDARMLYGAWQYRGIGRYIKAMLQPLSTTDITAFLPQKQHIEGFKTISKGTGIFPVWEQEVLPGMASRQHLDYLLCPSITSPVKKIKGVKKIVVIYDLIFMLPLSKLPLSHSLYNNLGRFYRRFIAPRGYKTADILISISEFTKGELFTKFGVAKEKVQVIPCSIPNDWFVDDIVAAKNREKYFLTVTGDAPSKNLPRLLEAFSYIVHQTPFNDLKLKVVGVAKKSKPYFIEMAKKLNLADHVIFEGFLDNAQLQQAYRQAWGSLTLSLFEGFGIPIVEAMASGTPVVCSNTTSMPEVAGNAAIFADPTDVKSIMTALVKLAGATEVERDEMAKKGIIWSSKFSEAAVDKQINDFWRSL